MNEPRDYQTHSPLRLRSNIDSMEAYSKPSGPLPALNLQQTSLVGSSPRQKPPAHSNSASVVSRYLK